MSDPLIIHIGDNGVVTALPTVIVDPTDDRPKRLLELFNQEEYLRKASLSPGMYEFDVVTQREQKIIILRSVPGSTPCITYRRVTGSRTSSVEYQVSYEKTPSSYDWLSPWNFVKFMLFVGFMVGWALAAFD